jgi:hypothetical protein
LRTRPQLHPSASLSTVSTANDQFFDTVSARDQELFVALNAKRVQLAKDENCSLTSIAFDSVLRGITLHKPSTLHQVCYSSTFSPHLPLNILFPSWRRVASSEIQSKSYKSMGNSGATS